MIEQAGFLLLALDNSVCVNLTKYFISGKGSSHGALEIGKNYIWILDQHKMPLCLTA